MELIDAVKKFGGIKIMERIYETVWISNINKEEV